VRQSISFTTPMIPWAKGSIEIKIHKVTDKDNVPVYPAENVYESFLQADKLNTILIARNPKVRCSKADER